MASTWLLSSPGGEERGAGVTAPAARYRRLRATPPDRPQTPRHPQPRPDSGVTLARGAARLPCSPREPIARRVVEDADLRPHQARPGQSLALVAIVGAARCHPRTVRQACDHRPPRDGATPVVADRRR